MNWLGTKTEPDTETAELRARIAQLEAAVHTLVGLEILSNCPQSSRGGARGGDPLPALEPFVTRRDFQGARVTKRGVGDQ